VKIPEHSVVWRVGSKMALVAPIRGLKLDEVANEKDGQIVKDKVLDAVFCAELGGRLQRI
jgi:hypothetical protein